MRYYLAPLEEVTGYVFRNLVCEMFGEFDKVFSPFVTPTLTKKIFRTRDLRDVKPENNTGRHLVPQMLTNNPDRFMDGARMLWDLGYREININLGCPSNTVVAKNRGCGMLRDVAALDDFLQEIFRQVQSCWGEEMAVSAKVRAGIKDPAEFEDIYEILSGHPFSELIIHPRVQKDFYKNSPHMEAFDIAVRNPSAKLCYNGDIYTVEDLHHFTEQYPGVDCVMLGRGVIRNPAFLREIRGAEPITMEERKEFHDRLFEGYQAMLGARKDVLFKMKEIWFYWQYAFPGREKKIKTLLRTKKPDEYQETVSSLFSEVCSAVTHD